MNCKPGDLAVLLWDAMGYHTGKVFEVVRAGTLRGHWLTNPELRDPNGTLAEAADDRCRPIRDQDGEDETLTWAGKPQSIKTPEAA